MPSPVKFREVKRYMEEHGWRLLHVKGSHHVFVKEGMRRFPIPVHHGEVNYAYYRKIKEICEGQ
jgi:predicted RNA binding protein YcfA (HicA-like mRNA interferase family)